MGLNLKDLVVREKTSLDAFSTKIIAIDAYNAIYQFLASIRGPDGLQLSDAEGRITRPGFSEFRCRTQVKIKLSDNYDVGNLLKTPLGNHIILIKGHHAYHLSKWHKMMIV